jgi:hypothetical protein
MRALVTRAAVIVEATRAFTWGHTQDTCSRAAEGRYLWITDRGRGAWSTTVHQWPRPAFNKGLVAGHGDTLKTAAGPTPARWPKPQLAPRRPWKLGQNPISVIAQRWRSFAADTIGDGNAQITVIPERVANGAIRLTALQPTCSGDASFGSIALDK